MLLPVVAPTLALLALPFVSAQVLGDGPFARQGEGDGSSTASGNTPVSAEQQQEQQARVLLASLRSVLAFVGLAAIMGMSPTNDVQLALSALHLGAWIASRGATEFFQQGAELRLKAANLEQAVRAAKFELTKSKQNTDSTVTAAESVAHKLEAALEAKAELEEELRAAKLEVDVLKKQAEGLSREYMRLADELNGDGGGGPGKGPKGRSKDD